MNGNRWLGFLIVLSPAIHRLFTKLAFRCANLSLDLDLSMQRTKEICGKITVIMQHCCRDNRKAFRQLISDNNACSVTLSTAKKAQVTQFWLAMNFNSIRKAKMPENYCSTINTRILTRFIVHWPSLHFAFPPILVKMSWRISGDSFPLIEILAREKCCPRFSVSVGAKSYFLKSIEDASLNQIERFTVKKFML